MYATLGVGFMTMWALFSGIGGLGGTVVLAYQGRYAFAGLALAATAAAVAFFVRLERLHWKALTENFERRDNT